MAEPERQEIGRVTKRPWGEEQTEEGGRETPNSEGREAIQGPWGEERTEEGGRETPNSEAREANQGEGTT